MVLNFNVCTFMLFGKKDALQTDLVFNNVTIKNSKEEKVLLIIIDSKLDFSKYLISITRKASIKLNAFTRVQKYMTSEEKTLLTSPFIKSQFNYCPLIWMFCSMKTLRRLNNIHERSLRHMHQD